MTDEKQRRQDALDELMKKYSLFMRQTLPDDVGFILMLAECGGEAESAVVLQTDLGPDAARLMKSAAARIGSSLPPNDGKPGG